MESGAPLEPPVRRFDDDSLAVILRHLEAQLARGDAVVEVPDPDLGRGRYSGARFEHRGRPLRHRPLRAWCDLAERLGCRLLTPRARDDDETHVTLRFERLGPEAPWHAAAPGDRREKYGADSPFAEVDKLEDPAFLLGLLEALGRVPLEPGGRVLVLGVNRGDELAALTLLDRDLAERLTFVGVDHSASALAQARERFPDGRHRFLAADLAALPSDLGRFDLIVSVATLQSPGVDDRALLRDLVGRHLTPQGSLLLGFPNCRFRDGEVIYGARVRNLREPDLSLLVKDLAFTRRYLQQHRFRVFIGGKYDLLLTAVRTPRG